MKHTIAALLLATTLAGASQNTTYLAIEGSPIDQAYTDNRPYMEMYTPENPCGAAIIICPGGGYQYKTMDYEGRNFAPFFCQNGITVFVLSYTLPYGNCEAPLASIEEAMRGISSHAAAWGIDPQRIGVMGSSAGGHLASLASTHFRSPEERPAFSILVYPVISMGRTGHRGSMENLLGKNPDNRAVETYSNELHVSPQAPPAFIVFSDDDPVVDPRNGTLYYDALKVNGVPAELHIYPTGGHGWGMSDTFEYIDEYKTSLSRWLSKQR